MSKNINDAANILQDLW